jgi:hypothetical protein
LKKGKYFMDGGEKHILASPVCPICAAEVDTYLAILYDQNSQTFTVYMKHRGGKRHKIHAFTYDGKCLFSSDSPTMVSE